MCGTTTCPAPPPPPLVVVLTVSTTKGHRACGPFIDALHTSPIADWLSYIGPCVVTTNMRTLRTQLAVDALVRGMNDLTRLRWFLSSTAGFQAFAGEARLSCGDTVSVYAEGQQQQGMRRQYKCEETV